MPVTYILCCESETIWKVATTKTRLPRTQVMAMEQIVSWRYLSFRIDSRFSHHCCCSALHTDGGFIWFGLGPPLPVLHTEHEPIWCASAHQPFCYSCSCFTPAMQVRHLFGSIFHQQISISLSTLVTESVICFVIQIYICQWICAIFAMNSQRKPRGPSSSSRTICDIFIQVGLDI